ncbi:hypothetical protein D3C79_772600 [compost metagenome]
MVHGSRSGWRVAPQADSHVPDGQRRDRPDRCRRASQRLRRPRRRRQAGCVPQHRAPYPVGRACRRRRWHPGPVATCQPHHHRRRWQAAAAEPAQPAPGSVVQRAVGQGLVRELRRAEVRLAVDRFEHRLRAQAEPVAADLRYPEGRVLRHDPGGPAGDCCGHLHRLLHGPGHAPQGQAGDRTDGSDADGDPRLLRRPVPRAIP